MYIGIALHWGKIISPLVLFLLLLAKPWMADGHFGTAEFRAHTVSPTPDPPRSTYLVVEPDIIIEYQTPYSSCRPS